MYGVRINDREGNSVVLTPGIAQVISSGGISMPSTLNADDTYGAVIEIPGSAGYPEEDIGAMIDARQYSLSLSVQPKGIEGPGGTSYHYMRFAYSPAVYYTRDLITGEMTEWTEAANEDTVFNQFPVMFWEKSDNGSFDSVQLFAAMAYLIFDKSAALYRTVYRIDCIYSIDYAVYLKNYQGG